ncbi:MAG: carbohydrate ABC transporter permease [Angelakisella sp.]
MKKRFLTYALLSVAVVVSLFPFLFMFLSATNSNHEILSFPPSLAIGSYLAQNMATLNSKINIFRVLLNSLLVSSVFTLLIMVIDAMAGYALVKFSFKGKGVIFACIMLTMMIPAESMYIPLFTMISGMGLANTFPAVILPPLANAFGIFLMRQNLMAFPTTLMEAARIDGYDEMQIFWRIVMPNMKPALAALGIYMFMSAWNSFMWPLIILSTKDMYTFPVALATLDGNQWRKDYGVIMLGASITTLPIMAIFLIFQKQFIAGVMGGAIKE